MPDTPPDNRELGHYLAMAQVGMEMVAPLILGLVVDHYAGTRPWGLIIGAVIGFVGGIAHLVTLGNRKDRAGREPPGGAPR